MATYYVDAVSGNDSNSGLAANAAKKTIMGTSGVMAAGFATAAGDTLYMAGTFRPLRDISTTWGSVNQAWKINKVAGHNLNSLTIRQWPGKQQAVVRLDCPIVTTVASGNWTRVADGVFDCAIPSGLAYWVNAGDANKHYTLTEGVVDVVIDWDVSRDAYGRDYGGLTQVGSAATCSSTANSWFFTPPTPGAANGGSGTLRVNFGDALITDTTALQTWGASHVIAFVPGNVCPIEVGTPTYQTYPTWGSYDGTKVTNFMLDGVHFFFGDPGYRKNKPAASGTGDDNTAYGSGSNTTGTVSTGYVRVADATGSTIQNCVFRRCGYHGPTWAGDHCTFNTYRNCVVWGLGPNTNAGSTAYVFYSGAVGSEANDIEGCRLYNCVAHLYTWLNRSGVPQTFPYIGTDAGTAAANGYAPTADGFISHTDGGSATDNVIRDIEVHRLKVIMYSDTFTTSVGTEAHHGQGFVGGNRCVSPASNTDPWSYPIRFVDCELVNGIVNRTSLYDNCAYIRCRFDLPRAGDYGPYVGGSGFYSGSIMGAASGATIVGYFGCEIHVDLGSSAGNSKILFQMNTDSPANSIIAVGCSFYNDCDLADHASNSQWFFYYTNGASSDTANRFYGVGNVFVHRYCSSTTDSGGPTRGLVRNDRSGLGATAFNNTYGAYANMTTDSYIQFAGGTNSGSEANFTTNVDPNGVYLGQDPTVANIALGNSPRNPFVELGGQTLRPAAQLMERKSPIAPNAVTGINIDTGGAHNKYDGTPGAWQFGSEDVRVVARDRGWGVRGVKA